MRAREHEPTDFLPYMALVVQRCLKRSGLAESQSKRTAADVVSAVQETFGGGQHYIPLRRHPRQPKTERAAEAARLQSQGLSTEQIRLRLGCSLHYVYVLLSIERKRVAEAAATAGPAPSIPTIRTPTRK